MTTSETHSSKVFGIGFHKTATTSLAEALRILGYRVTGPNGIDNPRIADEAWSLAKELVSEFDAFQDNPWPILFRQLDETYPGSKFILTIRPAEAWLKSILRHFGHQETPMRKWIYGVGQPAGNETIYAARFEEHNRLVLQHFKDRPADFLVMDITAGDGWNKLCPFLGKAMPETPFPVANTAVDRESNRNPIFRWVRSLKKRL